MSLSSLQKEDYEKILNAFEVGEPPSLQYLPLVYAGRKNIIKELLAQLQKLSTEREQITEYAFINGERGQGKTMTSLTAIQIASRQLTSYNFIPVYIDLGIMHNPLDIFRHIFLTILTRAFGLIDFNDPYQSRLFRLMEAFSIDLNYHKLRPDNSSPPLTLLDELCEVVADLKTIVCIIVDEFDVLDTEFVTPVIDASMEMFRSLNKTTRLPKFWIFCSTISGEAIFQKLAEGGNAFGKRIYQARERIKKYKLRNLSDDEMEELIDTVIDVFMATRDQKRDHLQPQSAIISSLRKVGMQYILPRDIIGNVTSMLYLYKDTKNLWKKGISTTNIGFGGSIGTGSKFDHEFKRKLLPYFGKLSTSFNYSSNPPKGRSFITADKFRDPDGVLTFEDDYKVFLEIKYTDSHATLTRDNLDQIAAPVATYENSVGIYLLFGKYSDSPVKEEDFLWLKGCKVEDKIKYFHLNDPNILNSIKMLVYAVETSNDSQELVAACKWILKLMKVLDYLDEIAKDHKGIVKSRKSLTQYLSIPPDKTTPQKTSPIATATVPQKFVNTTNIIPLVPKKIKGLGTGFIDKLKAELGIKTVNKLVETNPDTIATIRNISAKRAKEWIEEGKMLIRGYA